MTTLKQYDFIRENRQGAPIERVLSVVGNMVETYGLKTYHITKVRKVNAAFNAKGEAVEVCVPTAS